LDWTGLDRIALHWMGLRVHSHLKIVGFVLEKEEECRSSHVSRNPVQYLSDWWMMLPGHSPVIPHLHSKKKILGAVLVPEAHCLHW